MGFPTPPTQDDYLWRVHYASRPEDPEGQHEAVDEYDAEYPTGRGFATVDLSRVAGVELLPQRPWLRPYYVMIDASRGMRPIFFRRRSITLDPTLEAEHSRSSATCLGFQVTLEVAGEKRNVSSYTFIFSDGSTLVTDDHNAF